MKKELILASSLILLAVGGCASKGQMADSSSAGAEGTTMGADSSASGVGNNNSNSGQTLNNSNSASGNSSSAGLDLSSRSIYFDFDADQMQSAGEVVVSNFGRYLSGSASRKLRLEGHTDEQGSREYNLALAERRAQSVARALRAAGAGDGQLSTFAYGEERPADPGHDEAAWAKNRRVDLVE